MKKLSIILLALALVGAFALPAMAGDFSISGKYVLDGEKVDYDGDEAAWYDNDVDVYFKFTEGDVAVYWRAELDDTEGLQGAKNNAGIIDDLHVTYKFNDALTFKFGEYYIGSSAIADDTTGGFNVEVKYSLDAVDLAFAIVKKDEDNELLAGAGGSRQADAEGDTDTDRMVLKANFKDVGPMTKLNFVYVMEDDQVTEEGASFMVLDLAAPIGPVTLGFQYGSFGGTDAGTGADAEGNYMLVDIGLEELVGFDFNVRYFSASDDLYGGWEEDYAPYQIIQDEVQLTETSRDMTVIGLHGSYAYNDKLTFGGAYVMAETTDGGDDIGTEFDVIATYKIADNVTYKAAIGSFSADAAGGDITKYFNRLTVTF